MATKTVTVTEEAYALFKGLKKEEESFTDVFIRLAKEKDVVMKYFGILKKGDISKAHKKFKKIRKDIGRDVEVRKHVLSGHFGSS